MKTDFYKIFSKINIFDGSRRRKVLEKHIQDLLNAGLFKDEIIGRIMEIGVWKKEELENVFQKINKTVAKEETERKVFSFSQAKGDKRQFYYFFQKEQEEKSKMSILDLMYLASRSFRSRTSRTTLTILGISVGFGAILFLVSLGYGLQNLLVAQISSSDALLSLSVMPSETIELTPERLEYISKLPEVVEVSPMMIFPAEIGIVNEEDVTSNTIVQAVYPSYFRLSAIKTKFGSVFENDDSKSVIISTSLAESLNMNPPEKSLNKNVKLTLFIQSKDKEAEETINVVPIKQTFKIDGVIDDPTLSYLFLPLNFVKTGQEISYREAKIKVAKGENLTAAQEKIINIGFLSSSLSGTLNQANKIFRAVQIILAFFGIIALVVSAIGMINTMTITLLERINEIGIMKAVGAADTDVKKLFLTEAVLISGAGGIGGLIIGFLGQKIFNLGINFLAQTLGGKAIDLFYQPAWFVIVLVIFSIVVGFLTGLMPARRAAKINPLKALRYK